MHSNPTTSKSMKGIQADRKQTAEHYISTDPINEISNAIVHP